MPLVAPSKESTIIVELTGRCHLERRHARIKRLAIGSDALHTRVDCQSTITSQGRYGPRTRASGPTLPLANYAVLRRPVGWLRVRLNAPLCRPHRPWARALR